MKPIVLYCVVWLFISATATATADKPGAYLGALSAETPHWFKDSFLDFEEDVAEAAQQNKRVMLYFHQEGCPYCARLVEENFAKPEIENYVREHFDGVEINMWGDREIVSIQGKNFTEKTFAAALKVQYTPTLMVLDEQGKVALRLNGYYPPEKFKLALHYAANGLESKQSFNEFMRASLAKDQPGTLISEDFFIQESDLQSLIDKTSTPTALYFETSPCDECEVMHQRILTDGPTRDLVKKMNNLQFDLTSNQMITTIDGSKMPVSEYARDLNIAYTPAVVLLDEDGVEVHRMEGFLKTFHFQSSLAYVLDKAYVDEPSFQRYISARGEKIREMGFDTDIWGYDSFHTENPAIEN